MTEAEIERKMRGLIKAQGGLFYKFLSPGNPGVPDRIVITPAGEVWFVELKAEKGRLTKLQQHQISLLERQGAKVRVVYGWDTARGFVEEVLPSGI